MFFSLQLCLEGEHPSVDVFTVDVEIVHIPQTPEEAYCYYKLVTNVIGAVKIHVLS